MSPLIDPRNPKAGTLLDVITAMLQNQKLACSVEEIRFCRSHPWVKIVYADGAGIVTYHPKNLRADWSKSDPNKWAASGGREEYVVGPVLLQQIAIDFAKKQERAE